MNKTNKRVRRGTQLILNPQLSRMDGMRSIISPEDEQLINDLIKQNPDIFPVNSSTRNYLVGSGMESSDIKETWIQTYSGRRFNPLNPVKDAIVIQDIAHSLSMLCRFTGHCKLFYSVAQHSVLVSYLCDSVDAMHGLLHDSSEAYLTDLPRPLKQSGEFENYKKYENTLQKMIFNRFNLSEEEPASVKKADIILLATEARDLMAPLHTDWKMNIEPLPMKIEPLNPAEAKNLFMKRFFELSGSPGQYEHYLRYEAIK